MAHSWHHAESSARKFGGVPEDYCALHDWLDQSKAWFGGYTHRALRHHAQGIHQLEQVFGRTLTNSAGRVVPVRFIGEHHVKEDCGGRIPSLQDWVERIAPAPWMSCGNMQDDELCGAQSVSSWIAEVTAGRTILGYLDWIEARRADPCVRLVLDASTGHLTPATREWLDRLDLDAAPSTLLRGAYGWTVSVVADRIAFWPDDMAAVLSHALAEGCAFVLFDRDGPVVEALPWRDEGGAP